MGKIIGYVLSLVGIFGIAAAVIPELRGVISIPKQLTDSLLTIISIAITVVGIFFIMRSGKGRGKKVKEVPIYHGKDVVGYRRT